jgi:hypothetical protein
MHQLCAKVYSAQDSYNYHSFFRESSIPHGRDAQLAPVVVSLYYSRFSLRRTTIWMKYGVQASAVDICNSCLEGKKMLWTIFVILLVLWLLGLVSSYTLGGFIHILLVLALVVLVIQLVSGRRAAL